MYVRRYSEVDSHETQTVIQSLKSSKIVRALTVSQAKIHMIGINILKGVKAIGAGIKSGYNVIIKPEIMTIRVSAEKMINKPGVKKLKNSIKMAASVLFLSWAATLPVTLVYNTTVRWISKAAVAVQPYWTWFNVAATSLAIASAVFGSISTAISIKKMRRAEKLLKSSTVGDNPMMESILNGVKKKAIQKMFTANTVGFNKRLEEIQKSDDAELKKKTESLLEGRVRSVIKIQKLVIVANIISVIGSTLIVSGVPVVGLPLAIIGAAIVGGVQVYAQVQTYRFETKLGMVVVPPHKDTDMIRKRDKIKSFVKWQFSSTPSEPAYAKVKVS